MARDFAKVKSTFWTGETGRKLRENGRDVQLLALYLITCPEANMIGLYHLALPTLCHYLGMSREGALKGLARASEGGFCSYDAVREEIFIPEMAAQQIGEPLGADDNRVKGIVREWQMCKKSMFYMGFYDRYASSYHLPKPKPLARPFQGASKALPSQETETEIEMETTKANRGGKFHPHIQPIPSELNTPEFREAIGRWIRHREEIGKPLTETSFHAQLKKMLAWGAAESIDRIERSIANTWQGLDFGGSDARGKKKATAAEIDAELAKMGVR